MPGKRSQGIKLGQAKEETCDPDYLPRGRPHRRKPFLDEFDRECGYAYEHVLVFVRFASYGVREYECGNCGERTYKDGYDCDPDMHEMLEVGALELAFQPHVNKSRETIEALRKDSATVRFKMANRKKPKDDEEEVDLDA